MKYDARKKALNQSIPVLLKYAHFAASDILIQRIADNHHKLLLTKERN